MRFRPKWGDRTTAGVEAPAFGPAPLRLVAFVPAVVRDRRHLEMLRLQSLLRDRLRLYDGPGTAVSSCVILDDVAPGLRAEVESLDFDLRLDAGGAGAGGPTGIRRPTERFLLRAAELYGAGAPGEEPLVLRVIQDTPVTDARRLARCDDIGAFMDELGLPRRRDYTYVQGALMLAPLPVWLAHYPRLPAGVRHLCDDSVMSQLLLAAGGELVALPACWEHRHDCPEDRSRRTYDLHRAELAGGGNVASDGGR